MHLMYSRRDDAFGSSKSPNCMDDSFKKEKGGRKTRRKIILSWTCAVVLDGQTPKVSGICDTSC
jgi:hypothetical protein